MRNFKLLFLLLSLWLTGYAQKPAQNSVSPFQETGTFQWNTANGLPYIQSFSGNYSAEVYRQPAPGQLAFLSRANHSLLLFNTITGKKEKSISLPFSPVDFTVTGKGYFVAGTQNLYALDPSGKIMQEWYFGDRIRYVDDIKYVNNRVCLITPDQKTWILNTSGHRFEERDGIILNDTWTGKVLKKGRNRFQIILNGFADKLITKNVTTVKPLGTLKLIGLFNNLLFVEVQTIEKELPLKVKRNIRIYKLGHSKLEQVSDFLLPDIYYTYIKHDVTVSASGLSVFISAPEEASVYRLKNLKESAMTPNLRLPAHFYQTSYQYNNHLLPAMESSPKTFKNVKSAPITRKKIIQNAEPYATHKWYCHASNIWDRDCGGVHVKTPSWVTVGNNISVPYMWGGFSSLSQFDQGITNGVSAGDSDTHGNGAGSSCAVGVDCSGFVSRAWGLGTKYCTRCIPDISTRYPSYDDLKPGDVVNYEGHHVRLIHTVNDNGSFLIIEAAASSTDWRVGYNNYSVADFQGRYLPRKYNQVIEGKPDTIPPTTSITAQKWETGDFTVQFTDRDNEEIKDRFYLVSYRKDNHWEANGSSGFFTDNFSSSGLSAWKTVSGHWSVENNSLLQSDESGSNTNLYTRVAQNGKKYSFLYQWKMKIEGTGDNRRAGIHFMSDIPTYSQRNNSYLVYFRADQNTCQIYKCENNSIDLKTSDYCDVQAGEWFDAKILFNTATGEIDVFKDNRLVSAWIDAEPLKTGTSLSLRTGNARTLYDDMKVFRSRNSAATITVKSGNDVPVQNTSPAQPACRLFSIVADSMHNLSPADTAEVNIDWTPPANFTVNDGTGNDIDTTHTLNELSANWTASSDPNSGIAAYYCCAGTAPGSQNILSWFNNGKQTRFTKTGLSLPSGDTCYVSVTAINGAGLPSDTLVSDGMVLLQPTGIHTGKAAEKLVVYPVPAKTEVWVQLPEQENTLSPELFDLSGKNIHVAVSRVSSSRWKISLRNVSGGIYFVRIKTGGSGSLSQKIVVVK